VDQQVEVKLSIGNYEDKFLYDIIPMEACHIFLGRPWKFDKKTMHNGLTNEITLHHKEKKFVLHPLTLTKVFEDQLQMRKLRDEERKEESMHKELGEQAPNTCIHEEGESSIPPNVTQKKKTLSKKTLKKTLIYEATFLPPLL